MTETPIPDGQGAPPDPDALGLIPAADELEPAEAAESLSGIAGAPVPPELLEGQEAGQ